jgi:uncharacterized membrane protein YagU involved in acid resistance
LSGALAGLLAAIPMGLVMIGLNRALPARKRHWYTRWTSLPPKQITNRLFRRAGLPRGTTQATNRWDPVTWLAHMGYGAATASVYPLVTRTLPIPGVLRGMLFALGVWAASYMGWLPAAKILPPATQQPARRNTVMILSHLVWGLLIGLLANRFSQRLENRLENRQSSSGTSRI